MSKAESQRQVLELPEEDRLEIAETIWSSLENPNTVPLPQWQRALLDERRASLKAEEGRDWEDVKADFPTFSVAEDSPKITDELVKAALSDT